MTRGVYKVECVGLAAVLILHLDGVALDGDTALFFQVHVVEHLTLCNLNGARALKQAVGKGALAVVNMGYDAEIAYFFQVGVDVWVIVGSMIAAGEGLDYIIYNQNFSAMSKLTA